MVEDKVLWKEQQLKMTNHQVSYFTAQNKKQNTTAVILEMNKNSIAVQQ